MDPRKFVVKPESLDCQEIEDYQEIGDHCKIARWHCHPNLILVEAIYFCDWVFYATSMVPVVMGRQSFLGVIITQFDHYFGKGSSIIRTANIVLAVPPETSSKITETIVPAFTPVGRILKVLEPDGSFVFEKIEEKPQTSFSDILTNFHIIGPKEPENN
jgi:hypothetical protein